MKANFTHYSHRSRHVHKVSLLEKLSIWFLIPIILVALTVGGLRLAGMNINASFFIESIKSAPIGYLSLAFLSSFARLFISYIFSLVIGVALALFVLRSHVWERVLIPVYDVLESVPVLVFFPVIILFFIHYNLLNTAAIFILILTMIWSIVFAAIGGLHVIPEDVLYVPKVFGLTKFRSFRKVILPALFPSIVTGSLLAWAAGWNILIVAEVLHTYVPAGQNVGDVFGIGSVLVQASSSGNQSLFLWSIVVIVAAITLINVFVWQKLLRYASRFRFD
jgi:NitT/TauT family transport system permease protein